MSAPKPKTPPRRPTLAGAVLVPVALAAAAPALLAACEAEEAAVTWQDHERAAMLRRSAVAQAKAGA